MLTYPSAFKNRPHCGFIVPALQIVQPRVRIVVIPPIPERIERADNLLLNRCRARLGGNRAVAPRIVCVRAYLGSVFRVDGDDVPLQVLLEVVGVKRIRSIGLVSVLQPDGSAVLIIEVYQEVVRGLRATTALRRPCLGDDLGAVQRVVVDRTAICLDGSDAIGVIREGIQELSPVHGHLHEFATVPLQRIPVVGGGVADGVILIYRRTDLCQPIVGITVRLGRGCVTRCAYGVIICRLTCTVSCLVKRDTHINICITPHTSHKKRQIFQPVCSKQTRLQSPAVSDDREIVRTRILWTALFASSPSGLINFSFQVWMDIS